MWVALIDRGKAGGRAGQTIKGRSTQTNNTTWKENFPLSCLGSSNLSMQACLHLEVLGAFWFLWPSLCDLPVPFQTLEGLGRALCPWCYCLRSSGALQLFGFLEFFCASSSHAPSLLNDLTEKPPSLLSPPVSQCGWKANH